MPKFDKTQPLAASLVTTGYIVTKAEQVCTIVNVTGLHRGGVLLPGVPVVEYLKKRDARRAIKRTERAAARLRGSLIDDWPRLNQLLAAGEFTIVPVARQQ